MNSIEKENKILTGIFRNFVGDIHLKQEESIERNK